MSAGDDSGALSRTSGLFTGLLAAQERDMTRADEQAKEARTALQKMRGRVPGSQMAALVPAWNPANDAPEEALSPAVAGYMATQRGAARNKSAQEIARMNRNMQKAIADAKMAGGTGSTPKWRAVKAAQEALKLEGLTTEDPEGASLYEQTYNLALGSPTYESLFSEAPQDPSAWFPGPKKMRWNDPNFENQAMAPQAPAPGVAPAPAAKPAAAAPAAGGWSARKK